MLSVRQKRLILKWRRLAFHLAIRYYRLLRARGVSRRLRKGDLIGAALVGLTEAALNFEPGRGNQFSSYAWPCIKGMMYSEVRRFFRDPLARAWPMWRDDKIDPVSLEPSELDNDGPLLIARAMKSLSGHRKAAMIYLHYFKGLTGEEIGKKYGITKSRVYQIIHRGVRELGIKLANEEERLFGGPGLAEVVRRREAKERREKEGRLRAECQRQWASALKNAASSPVDVGWLR